MPLYRLYGPPRPRGSSGDAEKVRQVRLNSDASEPCRPCISELREERPARGTRTAYGYSGHEEYREREVASGHFGEGLFVLRPQFAHSLSGSWLHDSRPDRRRRPDRSALQAFGGGTACTNPRRWSQIERTAVGRLEEKHRGEGR